MFNGIINKVAYIFSGIYDYFYNLISSRDFVSISISVFSLILLLFVGSYFLYLLWRD